MTPNILGASSKRSVWTIKSRSDVSKVSGTGQQWQQITLTLTMIEPGFVSCHVGFEQVQPCHLKEFGAVELSEKRSDTFTGHAVQVGDNCVNLYCLT
mmetsp:Transcript_66973/g.157917  ORF Transcript_66973/g.157917 Transcript_66973/m.157917 type:complete len:97 (-) Transcript_66973:158-448(-)